MKPSRLEAFSDGVMAIIITIMVLEMKVPHDTSPQALFQLWPVFLSYILSFAIVAIYWVNHHHLIHLAGKVDGRILWWNIHLLFWISLMPFVTAYMGENHATPLSVALYSGVATASSLGFYLLRDSISCHHQKDPKLMALHARMGRKNLWALVIYLGAVAMSFASVPFALVLVALPAVMYFMPDRRAEAT
jgi:uncharacterized membrane protein